MRHQQQQHLSHQPKGLPSSLTAFDSILFDQSWELELS